MIWQTGKININHTTNNEIISLSKLHVHVLAKKKKKKERKKRKRETKEIRVFCLTSDRIR